jgi:hypothetical protein
MQWRYRLVGSSLSGHRQNRAAPRDFTFKRNNAAANSVSMKKTLLLLAPLSMLALAACNKSETPAEGETGTETPAATAAPVELPPAITASGTYRCADNTILYVDFLGKNEAADIRVGDKAATAVRVTAPVAEAPAAPAAGAEAAPAAETAPAGPMKSADGESSLSGEGKQINVKLAGKGAQTCKSS